MRAIVVGAGVIGLACAWSLAERGVEVEVLEAASAVGAGASAGNTGWIVPSLSTPLPAPGMLREGLRAARDPKGALILRPSLDPSFIRWLLAFRRACGRERYAQGVRALVDLNRRTLDGFDAWRTAGVAFEESASGVLIVGRDAEGVHWFADLHAELAALGHTGALERLGGDEARALEPALGAGVGAALHARVDRHVRPESLLEGLATALAARGVAVRYDAPVTRLAQVGGGWSAIAGGAEHRADVVVVAAGAAAVELARPLGLRLPIVGGKGYSVTLAGEGTRPRIALYLSEAKVGTSTYADGLRIAGFFELPATTTTPDAARVRQLVEEASGYLADWRPRADEAGVAGWAGLRPATPDGLPLLGPVPGRPGAFIAAGHAMLGMTLAPATGEAIAELVTSGAVPERLRPFAPARRM